MKKVGLALVGAGALSFASMAGAAIIAPASGTTTAGTTFSALQGTTLNSFEFDTTAGPTFSGTANTSFNFVLTDVASLLSFGITNSSGTVTLAQLIGGTFNQTFNGSGTSLSFSAANLNPGTYSLSYTSNLGLGGKASGNAFETSAVPEPATWALMLLGFGGMGVAMRRSRKRVIAQIA